MKRAIHYFSIFVFVLSLFCSCGIQRERHSFDEGFNLAKPTPIQYKWHEQERIMFLHFAPTTWIKGTQVEQNDHSIPLDRIKPQKLNTDQWCETALSWGAKEIIFVAKHSGGFCWWQTETTEYGIKETPYKNGQGDVLKELSESCKKYGLNLGVYVYPGDKTWGAMIGSGGKTKDPSKQEAYNEVFRTQLTEVLTKYGEMLEVWFDGSCVIDISDIMAKYAKNSVVFQGPHASIRWPGTESGNLFYPAWNSVNSEDLSTGVSTQIDGNPDGDAWAPLETNTTLYDHYWFWSEEKVKKRKSVDELMENYYRSVGHGSVFLLNASPDTTGLIPTGDVKRYAEFGEEIKRRFGSPIAELKSKQGKEVFLTFDRPGVVNHAIIMEDYREGERIRKYKIEGLSNGQWKELCQGISVGRKKIDFFEDVEISAMRLSINESAGMPLIRSFAAYYVSNFIPPRKQGIRVWSKPQKVHTWKGEDLVRNELNISIPLKKTHVPGQYQLSIMPESKIQFEINKAEIYYNDVKLLDDFVQINNGEVRINQTAQLSNRDDISANLSIIFKKVSGGKIELKPLLIH